MKRSDFIHLLPAALLGLAPALACASGGSDDGHAAHAGHASHAGHVARQEQSADAAHATHAHHADHSAQTIHPADHVAASDHAAHTTHPAQANEDDAHAHHRPADQAGSGDPHAAHRPGAHHAAHAHHMPDMAPLPREPVPALTDADRAAAFPPLRHGHAHGGGIHSLVRFDRLEAWDARQGSGQAWEVQAWAGGDLQRVWLRSEGMREHGHLAGADVELLYGRATSAWWDVLAGVRHDFGPHGARSWAALGVQGMAPYKFEVAATAYLGSGGQTALRAEVEYELLLTSRLALEPQLEVELHGRDDPRRRIGAGLSSAEAGLRLRWAVTPRFAPYVGVVHERSFGDTRAHLLDDAGHSRDTRWVAGLRWWF